MSNGQEPQEPMESYLGQVESAERFKGIMESAIACLATGDAERFMQLLSPNFRNMIGDERIMDVLHSEVMPFFSDGQGIGSSVTVTNTTDAFGNTGNAFYASVLTGADTEKPFIIYAVEEEGEPVIANILVNKTYEDMHS